MRHVEKLRHHKAPKIERVERHQRRKAWAKARAAKRYVGPPAR